MMCDKVAHCRCTEEFFPVCYIHRNDIAVVLTSRMPENDPHINTIVEWCNQLSDEEMIRIADRIGELYLNFGYWEVLKATLEELDVPYPCAVKGDDTNE